MMARAPLLALMLLAGCSLFTTREPEPPATESGTFAQPDAPEQVIDNIRNAIAELNTLNYRRSLSEDLVFRPTATAEARDAIWTGWGRAEEEQYFNTLVAAAAGSEGHGLVLNDQSLTVVDVARFQLDATYVLNVNHRRPDASTMVQGRLIWQIIQRADGLWELAEWTDQELAGSATWSDLKAEFVK
ncbi:MAG: hypothetical protein HKN29_11435 [Rhodothermales bacterium]|nr:hypothetical protein [Rhodothermales bacterium]